MIDRGPWIYPHAYGGWAQLGTTPTGSWSSQAVRTHGGTIDSGKLEAHKDGGSMCSIGPCGRDYVIWSSSSKSLTNWYNSMVTSSRSPFYPGPNPVNPVNPGRGFSLGSNGTTLFRRSFNLTQEQYDRIVAADSSGVASQGLFLDINADDFYNVYINGVPAVSSAITVQLQRLKVSDPGSILRVGQNIIAVQVTDKILARARASDVSQLLIAAGLWYNLRAEVPVAQPDVRPIVTPDKSTVSPGESVTFSYLVNNNGLAASSADTRYNITYNNSVGATAGCTRSGTLSGIPRNASGVAVPNCPQETVEVDASWSDQICATLEIINPKGPDSSSVTARACVDIAKKPIVQISGGDVVVRGPESIVQTSLAQIDGRSYGGWAEYGVFGSKLVNTHSGASLMARSNPDTNVKNSLTFANTPLPAGNFGAMGSRDSLAYPDLPEYIPTAANPIRMIGDLPHNRITKVDGDLEIEGSTGLNGLRMLEVDGTLLIKDSRRDIQYNDVNVATRPDLPQIIIKAKNIVVQPGISRIDAWLIAEDTLVTCGKNIRDISFSPNYYSGLTTEDECNDRKLDINGPVQAKRIILRRTNGAEGSSVASRRAPAERFNLRADTYLWAYSDGYGRDDATIRTETVKSLPPRF